MIENLSDDLNQTAGLALGGVPGPYTYKGDMRYYAIEMHPDNSDSRVDALRFFVRKYFHERKLPDNVYVSLNEDSDYFYLVTTNFGTRGGGTNVGIDSVRSVYFHVPVIVWINDEWMEAFVELFTFNEQLTSVITNREVRGINANGARIRKPRTPTHIDERRSRSEQSRHEIHIEDLTSDARKVVTSVVAEVSDFVGLSAKKRWDTLLEIRTGIGPYLVTDAPPKHSAVAKDSKGAKDAKLRGRARKSSRILDVLIGRYRDSVITLKQFAAPSGGLKSSYQGLLCLDYYAEDELQKKGKEKYCGRDKYERKVSVKRVKRKCFLRIYEYDSHPIGHVFGFRQPDLDSSNRRSYDVRIDHVIVAKNVTLREPAGRTLLFRTENTEWRPLGLNALAKELRSYSSGRGPKRGSEAQPSDDVDQEKDT